jgi:hypothetical protein
MSVADFRWGESCLTVLLQRLLHRLFRDRLHLWQKQTKKREISLEIRNTVSNILKSDIPPVMITDFPFRVSRFKCGGTGVAPLSVYSGIDIMRSTLRISAVYRQCNDFCRFKCKLRVLAWQLILYILSIS